MTNGQKNKIATTFIVKIYCCKKIEKSLYFWPSSILWLKNSVQIYNKSKNTLLITRHMIPHPFDLSKIWRNFMNLLKDSFILHSIISQLICLCQHTCIHAIYITITYHIHIYTEKCYPYYVFRVTMRASYVICHEFLQFNICIIRVFRK